MSGLGVSWELNKACVVVGREEEWEARWGTTQRSSRALMEGLLSSPALAGGPPTVSNCLRLDLPPSDGDTTTQGPGDRFYLL